MKFTKISSLTGITNTRNINVSKFAMREWRGGALIQDAMPNISADEREFIMTGITPEEWEAEFGE